MPSTDPVVLPILSRQLRKDLDDLAIQVYAQQDRVTSVAAELDTVKREIMRWQARTFWQRVRWLVCGG